MNDVPGFQNDIDALDRADGKLDGKWRANDIDQLQHGFDTPARTAYQERVVETVVKNEGFGADDTPDLLYLNFKEIDYVGHVWSMNSPEMTDAVRYQDEALKRFVPFLDQQVGKGNWAMVITADHAAMPNPIVSGGFEISTGAVQQAIETRFDTNGDATPIVDNVQPGSIFLNEDEVAAERHHDRRHRPLRADAHAVADLRWRRSSPNPGQENDPVFAAVFPSSILPRPAVPARGRQDVQHRRSGAAPGAPAMRLVSFGGSRDRSRFWACTRGAPRDGQHRHRDGRGRGRRPRREACSPRWWAIALVVVILGLALGWRFLADPSLSAPTRDPAWYTWRRPGDPGRRTPTASSRNGGRTGCSRVATGSAFPSRARSCSGSSGSTATRSARCS